LVWAARASKQSAARNVPKKAERELETVPQWVDDLIPSKA